MHAANFGRERRAGTRIIRLSASRTKRPRTTVGNIGKGIVCL